MVLRIMWDKDNPSYPGLPHEGRSKDTLSAFGPSVCLESTDRFQAPQTPMFAPGAHASFLGDQG